MAGSSQINKPAIQQALHRSRSIGMHLCRVVTNVDIVGNCLISRNLTILASPPIQGLFPEGFSILLGSAFILPVSLFQAREAFAYLPRAVGLASVSVTFLVSTSICRSLSGLLPDLGFVGAVFSYEGMSFSNSACSI